MGRLGGLMNQDQDNTTTMFETTNGVLDENGAFWQDIPAFADAVTRAESGTAAVREKTGEQADTGDAEAKADARAILEEKAMEIGDQLSSLASKTKDFELLAKVNVAKSVVDHLPDSDLLVYARAVAKGAAENHEVLETEYKIMAAELDAAIAAFGKLKTAPRDAIVNRKVATLSLPEAIAFVRGIYRNEIDKMMTRFKKAQPDFYKAYFAARVVVNVAATHAAPQTKAKDAQA